MAAPLKDMCCCINRRLLLEYCDKKWIKHNLHRCFGFTHSLRKYSVNIDNQNCCVFLPNTTNIRCFHVPHKHDKHAKLYLSCSNQRIFSTASSKLDKNSLSKTEKKKARKEAKKKEILERKKIKTEKQEVRICTGMIQGVNWE